MATIGDFSTLTFDGTNLCDGTTYLTVIPDIDSASENSISVVRSHHKQPSFGLPTPLERVLTANCYIFPSGTTGFLSFDTALDTLKQLLDTTDGTKKLVAQRPGWTAARYLYCHVRQMAINRIERKVTWQFVASDPFWRANTGSTNTRSAITSYNSSWTLTNSGTKAALPKFTLSVNTANTNTWIYHRHIVLRSNLYDTPIPSGYMFDITNGGLDTATLVGAGKMQSDGDDIRIELDGKEVPRVLSNMNTGATKIWIRFPEPLPKLNVDNTGGEWIRLGSNLAPGTRTAGTTVTSTGTVNGNNQDDNVIAVRTWGSDGYARDLETIKFWQVTGTSGSVTIDLGSSKTINRVNILHLANTNAAKNFTIQTSPNNSDWTTQVTVTNNTVQGKYTVHDFNTDVACRYVKVDITAVQSGGTKTGLNKVCLYNATYRLVIKYGNATAGPPHWEVAPGRTLASTSVAWQPMFDHATSTNNNHVYTSFRDTTPEGQYRTMQWTRVNAFGNSISRLYPGSQDTLADPSTALGVAQVNAGTDGLDSWRIVEPCGIRGVNHTGYTKHNNTYYRWRQLSQSPNDLAPVQDWINNVNTSAAWSYYSWQWKSYTVPNYNQTKQFILFNLKRQGADPANATHYGEAINVTVQLNPSATPTCTFLTENTANVAWGFTIKNTTNNQSISLSISNLPITTGVVIDCDLKKVYRSDNNQNLLSAFTVNGVRTDWLTLDPGDNVMAWLERGVTSIACVTTWENRWV